MSSNLCQAGHANSGASPGGLLRTNRIGSFPDIFQLLKSCLVSSAIWQPIWVLLWKGQKNKPLISCFCSMSLPFTFISMLLLDKIGFLSPSISHQEFPQTLLHKIVPRFWLQYGSWLDRGGHLELRNSTKLGFKRLKHYLQGSKLTKPLFFLSRTMSLMAYPWNSKPNMTDEKIKMWQSNIF